MTRFAPFFEINLVHDYYGDQTPPIDFQPDLATQNLVTRHDLRLRLMDGRIECFASDDRDAIKALAKQEKEEKIEVLELKIAALKSRMADVPDAATKLKALETALDSLAAQKEVLSFTFRLRAQNSSIMAVSEHIASAEQKIAVMDAGPDAGDLLHEGDRLGEDDLRALEIDEFSVDDLLTAPDLISPPLAIVRLGIVPDAREKVHGIRFGAVKRFWIYHVRGGDDNANFNIKDRRDEIKFDQFEKTTGRNGMVIRSFRSDASISEQDRPDARFDLFRDGHFEPKPVVAPLPGPQAGPGVRDGNDMASEIYVNLW